MEALLAALGASEPAAFIRGSRWVYPVVNATHILGVALLVGSVAALDARILGLARSVPVAMAGRLLVPIAATGLGVALVAGFLLFAVKPQEYADNPVFLLKMALLVIAIVNAVLFARRVRRLPEPDAALKIAAAASLVLWLGVLLAGRMIAFAG